MSARTSTVETVISIVTAALGLEDRANSFDADTRLLGSLPELDSLGVVEIATALEDEFGFRIDETEFTAATFETIGTVANFVDASRT
jgi:acyl carrier protein